MYTFFDYTVVKQFSIQPHPTYLSTLKICRVELCTELNCLMLSSLPCFYAFCWSAIPTSCYIFNVFFLFLFMPLFLAADTCLSWSLPCITEQQVSPQRLPMQYWLKNHWPDQAFFKHSPHANSISNSTILRNNYISLLSDLCACVHVKKNGVVRKPYM